MVHLAPGAYISATLRTLFGHVTSMVTGQNPPPPDMYPPDTYPLDTYLLVIYPLDTYPPLPWGKYPGGGGYVLKPSSICTQIFTQLSLLCTRRVHTKCPGCTVSKRVNPKGAHKKNLNFSYFLRLFMICRRLS